MHKKNSLTPIYSLVQGSFWMSFCLSVCFAAVHLQAIDFSYTEIGLIMAAGNVLGTIVGPALASLSERNPRLNSAWLSRPLCLLRALCLLGLLFFPNYRLPAACLYILYIAVTVAINSMVLKFCVDAEQRKLPLDYGICRGIGSLCFVLLSMGMGRLVETSSVTVLCYGGLLLVLLQLVSHELLQRKLDSSSPMAAMEKEQQKASSLFRFFRQEPRFTVLLLGSVLLFFAHNIGTNFMINLCENVGGNTETMGYLNGFMAAMEIPVMLLFSKFVKGKRVSVLLSISFAAFLLKGLAISFAPNIPLLFAAHSLQAPSFALYSCAIVPYISQVIAPSNAAKAQSLAFSVTTLGAVLSSLIGGRLYDTCSVQSTMLVGTAVCVVGVLVCFTGIRKTEKTHK